MEGGNLLQSVRHALFVLPVIFIIVSPPTMTARGVPAPAPAAATGRIDGQVLLSTTLTSRRPRFRIYSDPGPGSRPPGREVDEMGNVVLYVQRASVPDGTAPARATMSQRDEQFVPHVLPVYRGATVDFPNNDDVFHNVFSLSSAKTFDLGRFPKGSSKSDVFEKSGTVQVFCHIHSDMSAIVLVLENPYFAIPNDAGRYVIEGVPPGEYTVVGWHERIKPVTRTVRVTAGETSRLDFNIPIPQPDDVPR
ncbi:MAG: carboxypeptidase regulatory-like domain-containing protein [Gemmatimonadaceae bacterium]